MDQIGKHTHMKAIVYTKYGPEDVLQLKDVDKLYFNCPYLTIMINAIH